METFSLAWVLLSICLVAASTLADNQVLRNSSCPEVSRGTKEKLGLPEMKVKLTHRGDQIFAYEYRLETSSPSVEPLVSKIWVRCAAPFPLTFLIQQLKPYTLIYPTTEESHKRNASTGFSTKEISLPVPQRGTKTRVFCKPDRSSQPGNYSAVDIEVSTSLVTICPVKVDDEKDMGNVIALVMLVIFVGIVSCVLITAAFYIAVVERRERLNHGGQPRESMVIWRSPQRLERHPNIYRVVNLNNPPDIEMHTMARRVDWADQVEF